MKTKEKHLNELKRSKDKEAALKMYVKEVFYKGIKEHVIANVAKSISNQFLFFYDNIPVWEKGRKYVTDKGEVYILVPLYM